MYPSCPHENNSMHYCFSLFPLTLHPFQTEPNHREVPLCPYSKDRFLSFHVDYAKTGSLRNVAWSLITRGPRRFPATTADRLGAAPISTWPCLCSVVNQEGTSQADTFLFPAPSSFRIVERERFSETYGTVVLFQSSWLFRGNKYDLNSNTAGFLKSPPFDVEVVKSQLIN